MKRTSLLMAAFAGLLLLTPTSFVSAQDHEGEHGATEEGADAGHGDEHGLSIKDAVGSIGFQGALVNFCLLLALFIYMGRKPVTTFFVTRRKQIEDDLQEAARLKEAAQEKFDEYASRLEKLDEELAQIREDMAEAGQKERDRIVADAESKAARMRKDTEFVIEQQLKQLRGDLTSAAVSAAVDAAREVLSKETAAADQKTLADAYVERLKQRIDDGIDVQGGA